MAARILKAVDLFCGCGGISAGLRRAGFKIIAGADIEPKYMATFQHNFTDAHPLNVDLTKYAPNEIMDFLSIAPGELDLLAGGPPCQGFSKNVPRKFRSADDTNNLLIGTFLEYCEAIVPKMILMENVAEMRNEFAQHFSKEIVMRLRGAGYAVTPVVLNAAEYGVPQRRRRAFFLAAKGETALCAPMAKHCGEVLQSGLLQNRAFVTVWDAIGDLPSVRHGEGRDPCDYAVDAFSDYQKIMRNQSGQVSNLWC